MQSEKYVLHIAPKQLAKIVVRFSGCSENPSSIVDCLREVLEDFVPSHLRSVGLSDPGPKDLKDIGGLRDAKHRILEALEFPAKVKIRL